MARVAGLPRAHAQGLFSYSNAVWPVVDLVLQRATGRDFEVLAAERLLGPLGVEPRFGEPVDGATPHRVAGPGEPPLPVAALGARAASAAGSRWWATAEDLLALAEVHLAEGAGLVHGGAVREQREVHVPVPQRGFADGWALGWASWRRGTYRAVGWNGYTNGHRAFLRIFPEQEAALALMTNGAGPLFGGAGGTALFDLVLPACADALGVPVPAAPAGQGEVQRPAGELAGRYGAATVRDAGDGNLLLEASFMGLAAPLRLARAYGTAFMAEPARPGGMPIVFEHDVLYLGPFALPRTGSI